MDFVSEQALEFKKIREIVSHYATFPPGQEAILSLTPQVNRTLIEKELEYVAQFRQLLEQEGSFPISGLYDIRQDLKHCRIEGASLSALSLYALAVNLEIGRVVRNVLERLRYDFPSVYLIGRSLQDLTYLERAIKNSISPEGGVLDSASPELHRIRREIIHQERNARNAMTQVLDRLNKLRMSQDDIITIRDNRLVIPVKDEFRHTVKGIVHHQSSTGATLFIEPVEAIDLNNLVEELKNEELQEIARILMELTSIVGQEVETISNNLTILTNLDAGYAKARFSQIINGCSPALHYDPGLNLKEGRHPLLLLKSTPGRPVVPLDLEIGKAAKTLVITGPNAGGKTVALKTIGLLSLMVQSGLQVPVHPDSEFPVFPKIFCDIGDQQSIDSDLSTFSSHIERIRTIITNMVPGSLILLDEIGKGTSPEEGSALSMAILNYLNQNNVVSIATTHHNALKLFAEHQLGMANGSMVFDIEQMKPTYRFRPQIPGSSYTFEISSRLGFPEDILRSARGFLDKDAAKVTELMAEIEQKAEYHRNLVHQVSMEQSRLDGLIKLYQQQTDNFNKEVKDRMKRALEEANEIVRASNTQVENAVREIRQSQADKEKVKEVKMKIAETQQTIKQRLAGLQPIASEPIQNLLPGDMVELLNFNLVGEVLDVSNSKRIRVQTGGKVLEVDVTGITKIKSGKKRQTVALDHFDQPKIDDRLDVRGMDSLEACETLDRYLEDAKVMGYGIVTVVHGKGKGILRKAVADHLRNHSLVKTFRTGQWNEGADGVTIVELK